MPTTPTLTDELWGRFGPLTVADLPDDVVTLATQCVLDWFGCALAGSCEPLAGIIRDEFADYVGGCTVVGGNQRLPPAQAALINGATGHALDFDDTHTTMGGHPTAPLLPAAWAMAESVGRTGAELLAAFVAGFEIECRLGLGIGGDHYAKGWHSTSTLGVFGATAAAAHLLRLDHVQFGNAFGLAASQASGLKANFGTMTKPFHAGRAAEGGVTAARLAARGFTANPDAIEANQGLAQAAGSGPGTFNRTRIDRHADEWLIRSTLFKYHAACYLTHASIEAASALMHEDLRGVESVKLVVNPSILDVCGIAEPKTGLEGKFSLRATTALTLLGFDTTDTATFVDATIQRSSVQSLLRRVTIDTDPGLTTTQSRVVVTTGRGDRSAAYDSGVPASDLPLQGAKLAAKFRGLATRVLGTGHAEELSDRIHELANRTEVRGLLTF